MQVSKWGNSLAIRLPASVVEVLGLKEGDDIEIHVAGARFRDQEGSLIVSVETPIYCSDGRFA
jgi:antitoxin component of MazEF toxin-antitoxin module